MSKPSGIAPERELEWIKLPKDTYDEMVVRLRDLKVENQRLTNENKHFINHGATRPTWEPDPRD
jgi:hypothetical protein